MTTVTTRQTSASKRRPSHNENSELEAKIVRDNHILSMLEMLLKGGWKEAGLRKLPEDYFSIDDILTLPAFKSYSWPEVREAVHSDGLLRFSVRGSKIRLKPPELNKDADTMISKKLAWILRHGAEKEGMKFEDGGYIYVDDMMALQQFNGIALSDIERVVNANDKKRFEIRQHPESNKLQIRATQGHSVKVEGLDLRMLTDPKEFPDVIHGTYFRNWKIIKNEGLKRMGRTHIHFAIGEPGNSGVVSGMRTSSEIIIFLNMEMAMKDNFVFHVSNNNVVLCEGDANGVIPPRYFKAVYQRQPRLKLDFVSK